MADDRFFKKIICRKKRLIMRARIKYDVMSQDELDYFKGRIEELLEQRGIRMNQL